MQTVRLELHKNWRKFGIGPTFFRDFSDIEDQFFCKLFVTVIIWKELLESDLELHRNEGSLA